MDQHVVVLIEEWKTRLPIPAENGALGVGQFKHLELLHNGAMRELVVGLSWVLLVRQDSVQVLCRHLLQVTVHLLLLVVCVFLRRIKGVLGVLKWLRCEDLRVKVPCADFLEEAVILIVHSFHV